MFEFHHISYEITTNCNFDILSMFAWRKLQLTFFIFLNSFLTLYTYLFIELRHTERFSYAISAKFHILSKHWIWQLILSLWWWILLKVIILFNMDMMHESPNVAWPCNLQSPRNNHWKMVYHYHSPNFYHLRWCTIYIVTFTENFWEKLDHVLTKQ